MVSGHPVSCRTLISLRQVFIYLFGVLVIVLSACSTLPIPGTKSPSFPSSTAATHPSTVESRQIPPEALPAPLSFFKEENTIRFEHLTPDNGLSQSVVTDILQDEQGFLWFATQDGLNRYDGYEFKIFKNDTSDENSLSSSFITSIEMDIHGDIWCGTDGGLDRYNPKSGRFTHYRHDPTGDNSLSENSISSIHIDSDGSIWVGTSNSGINRIDPETGDITRFLSKPADIDSLSSNHITWVKSDNHEQVWVGTLNGLNRFDTQTGKVIRYLNDATDRSTLSSSSTSVVYVDHLGIMWVGTFDAGLNRFDPVTGVFIRYQNNPTDPNSISHNSITSIFEDSDGRLWIGTQGGLNLMDRYSGRFDVYKNEKNDLASLNSDYILSIFEDNSGILWFGTFGKGLSKFDPSKNKFHYFQGHPSGSSTAGCEETASSGQVWSILEDQIGDLWIGTLGGLNHYNPKTGVWHCYLSDRENSNSLSNNSIFSIYQDRKGILWLGTYDVLTRFDPKNETFSRFNTPSLILAIYEDHLGQMWLGSSHGLIKFNPDTGEQIIYENNPEDVTSLSSNVVSAIQEDASGNLWVGSTSGGINRFDRQTEKFTRYLHDPAIPTSISGNAVLTIFPNPDESLWIGTNAGLNYFDPASKEFIAYRETDGLANNFIYGILQDEQSNLWLSTNRGISKFNPAKKSFTNFDKTDGLQDNEFNMGAYYQSQSGVMYFGGINGMNIFYPPAVQASSYNPSIVLTNFELFHKPVLPGPEAPIENQIESSQEIQLSYTDDYFEFEFASLHFSSPGEIQYSYIMEGLDEDWSYVGNRRFASYTNVPPGSYTFRVKATNSDGVWSNTEASTHIMITPPFWETLWFRIIAAVGLFTGIYGIFTLRIRAVENQRRQLETLVNQRTSELQEAMSELEKSKEAAEAANLAKSTFLANMSHEFRTPLNAILGFTQVMNRDQSLDYDQRENLNIIYHSSEHLLGLINDVLEMSKIEAGRISLNKSNFDLHRMLEGLEEMFALRAKNKGLLLELDLDPNVPQYVNGDEGKLRQILMNLLGNAVKFTETGWIKLWVNASPFNADRSIWIFHFEVEDTGPGIALDEQQEMFKPFVQTATGQQAQEGTGLGLSICKQYLCLMEGEIWVRSEVGKGSKFCFEIPLNVVPAPELENRTYPRRVVGMEPGQPVYRLLVVDNEENNRKLLIRLFSQLGFDVKEASGGVEAVSNWETWDPHLVWMDIRMPVMNGYEATQRIKATQRGRSTIIIALTASSLEEDREAILAVGCNDYMRKPFREEEIYAMLEKHLGIRFLYQEDMSPVTEASVFEEQIISLSSEEMGKLASRLKAAGAKVIDSLEKATILGDLELINTVIHQVQSFDPELAGVLSILAEKYEHDQILALIEKSQERA